VVVLWSSIAGLVAHGILVCPPMGLVSATLLPNGSSLPPPFTD
jgi:hypothetical protein